MRSLRWSNPNPRVRKYGRRQRKGSVQWCTNLMSQRMMPITIHLFQSDEAQVDLMQDCGKRLKAALINQLDESQSAEPRLLLMSVRSIDDEPPRLNLPSDGLIMVRHAAAVHRDMHDLQKLLKEEPLNNRMIVDAIGHYAEPRPEDLVKLMSDQEDLVGFLSGNSGPPSFEELMVTSNESEAASLLQRYESACTDASRDLKIFAEDEVNMQNIGKHLNACHADWHTKAEYYEKKAKEARIAAAAYLQLVKRNEEMIINHPAAVGALSQKVTELENRLDKAKTNVEAAKRQEEVGTSASPSILHILSYPCNPYFDLPASPQ
uniref:Uncharacterized protein n=1 Tax=Oryza punctata TaxID=4537 RepID=A0A0E0JZ56_ORYPU